MEGTERKKRKPFSHFWFLYNHHRPPETLPSYLRRLMIMTTTIMINSQRWIFFSFSSEVLLLREL